MPLIDLSGLTLNPEEARMASEAVFEKVFAKQELEVIHGVQTGINMQTQIPFFGKFQPFLLDDPGACGVNAVNQDISTSQKYWTPALLSGRLSHCQGDLTDSLWKMWRKAAKANPDYWSEIDDEQLAFLTDRITDAMYEDILLKTMFGDTAADVFPTGDLTPGTTTGLFTPFDGIWKQVLAGVTATTVYRYTITENAGASYVAQDNLASDRAILAMRDLYNNADARLFKSNPKFYMTRSLYNNYRDYLETQSLAFTVDRTEEGTTRDTYRGIEIIVREDWDRNIRAYFDNGTTWLDPHRIILTDPMNIPIGTQSEEDLQSLDMFYEKKDKQHYIDTALTLDAKLLEEYMIAVAY